jgi:hypothetical protein
MANEGPVIPAPLDAGEDFHVGPELTIYQAAMIYSGRHPHESFLRDGDVDDYLKFLKAGIPKVPRSKKRARARRSWDIYCELMKRIEAGAITPVRFAYQRSGELDPIRTVIRLDDVAALATDRGERPNYLRHIQNGATNPARAAGGPVIERARRALAELYPNGIPRQVDKANKILVTEVDKLLKQQNLAVPSDVTILRAARRHK